MKKNRLEFLKNQPVQFSFDFISPRLKKQNRTQTRKNQKKTEPKPSQTGKTEPNRFEPVFVLKNKPKLVGLNRFRFGFFKKNSIWLFVFIKTKPNRK